MNAGYAIATAAIAFFDALDEQEETLASEVLDASDDNAKNNSMETAGRRLAHEIDRVVRSLPGTARESAAEVGYALAGLADERILHHPAGGLQSWQNHLLERKLYGSSLAGEHIVRNARACAREFGPKSGTEDAGTTLAPLYLGIFRAGFEGALRGDGPGLANVISLLEETVGTKHHKPGALAAERRPGRFPLSPGVLIAIAIAAWTIPAALTWQVLAGDALAESERLAERLRESLGAESDRSGLEQSFGPREFGTAPPAPERTQ